MTAVKEYTHSLPKFKRVNSKVTKDRVTQVSSNISNSSHRIGSNKWKIKLFVKTNKTCHIKKCN